MMPPTPTTAGLGKMEEDGFGEMENIYTQSLAIKDGKVSPVV